MFNSMLKSKSTMDKKLFRRNSLIIDEHKDFKKRNSMEYDFV